MSCMLFSCLHFTGFFTHIRRQKRLWNDTTAAQAQGLMNSGLHGCRRGILAACKCMKAFSWIFLDSGKNSANTASLASRVRSYTLHWNVQVLPLLHELFVFENWTPSSPRPPAMCGCVLAAQSSAAHSQHCTASIANKVGGRGQPNIILSITQPSTQRTSPCPPEIIWKGVRH